MATLYLKLRDNRPDKSIPLAHYDLPIFGNLLYYIYQALKKTILTQMLNDIRKYGQYWIVLPNIGMQFFYSDPASIKEVLEDLDTYEMSPVRKSMFSEIFGNGIFMSSGDEWAYQRNLAKPIFSLTSRQDMFDVYHKCAHNLVELLEETARVKDNKVELQQLFKRFTLDTFCEIGFGCTFNSLKKPVEFSLTFDWLFSSVDGRILYPWKRILHAHAWRTEMAKLERYIEKIIEERRRDGWEGRGDFLSVLLEMEARKEITGVSSKFLRDQVVNFMVAGRDTTAILLSATFYFLSLHPEVDQKVRKEIAEVVGDNPVSMKHTKELKYLQNVLNESLRLHPPAVLFNPRITTKPVVLPNGARLPKGTQVVYSPFFVHRLKEYWGEDAEEFVPERWENPNVLKHFYQFVPFQKGPRICLGMNMAYEEAKACISILYQSGFQFSLVDTKPKSYSGLAILLFNEGVTMNVQKVHS
uniref:Cytochrome P450 n=1 Tax=Arcella intermedia TaxID=1963864 RepID=A0A6B2L318_9EUKA